MLLQPKNSPPLVLGTFLGVFDNVLFSTFFVFSFWNFWPLNVELSYRFSQLLFIFFTYWWFSFLLENFNFIFQHFHWHFYFLPYFNSRSSSSLSITFKKAFSSYLVGAIISPLYLEILISCLRHFLSLLVLYVTGFSLFLFWPLLPY